MYDYCEIRTNLIDFCDLAIEEANKIMRSSLTVGANIIAKAAQQNLVAAVQGANRPMKEGGTLYSGIRCFTWKNHPAATVHIYGDMNKNDGTWRLRFYDGGTKKRYLKKKTGEVENTGKRGRKKIKRTNKKYLGQITPKYFFQRAVSSSESSVEEAIQGRMIQKLSELSKQAKYENLMDKYNSMTG